MPDSGLHITTALATTWMPWLCLVMVLLVWLCCIMQPQYLRGLVSNCFASFAIGTAEQVPSIGSQVSQWMFNTVVPAVCVYVLVVQSAMYGTTLLAWLVALSMGIDLLRALTAWMVHYTFRLGKMTGLAYMRYFALRSMMTYLLFAIVLMIAFSSVEIGWLNLFGIMTGVYIIILGIQWTKLFCSSFLQLPGIIVYLITVELLPTVLLYEAGRQLYLQQIV